MFILRPSRLFGAARAIVLICLVGFALVPAARAGLKIDIQINGDGGGYFCFPALSTNSDSGPAPANTGYLVLSPFSTPNLGIIGQLNADNSGGESSTYFGNDFRSFANALTNGVWTLRVTNLTSTNTYTFTLGGFTFVSNTFPLVTVTSPTNGETGVTNDPLFTWQGPSAWQGTLTLNEQNPDRSFQDSQPLPVTQTSWQAAHLLPYGTNSVQPLYFSNATSTLITSTPVDSSSNPLPGWSSTVELSTWSQPSFIVGLAPPPATASHQLIAYYTCDFTNPDGSVSYQDVSGSGNGVGAGTSWGQPNQNFYTNDSAVGNGADLFTGYSSVSPPVPVVTSLAGSFSLSLWIKTTQSQAGDQDDANQGAGVVWAFKDTDDGIIPLALTGHKAAFYTGSTNGSDDTLHSVADVTTGDYVHIVVTRDQLTGVKKIYVNGILDAADIGSTDTLNEQNVFDLNIGGVAFNGYFGLVDDIQFYAGVLNADEVAFIYQHRGASVANATVFNGFGPAAYYNFDQTNVLAPDVSGNSNNIVADGSFNATSGPAIDNTDDIAGTGSISFDGSSFLSAPATLLPALRGDFSVSVWLKTTQSYGNQGDFAFNGAGVVAADVPGLANDTIPIALTGGEVAFNTGSTSSDDTVNSSRRVNDGQWHHVVVTRNQASGLKQIFIDGVLDSSDTGGTNVLSDPQLITIGAISDASDPYATDPQFNGYGGYQGLLDDLQIYARELTTNEVAYLYANPGEAITGAPRQLVWAPGTTQDWDTTTTNWTAAGVVTDFRQGDSVIFDDSANNAQVNMTTALSPAGMMIVGGSQFYGFNGNGSLTGPMSLTVQENNTSTLTTPDTYTGVTWVQKGALSLFNNGSISNSSSITVDSILYSAGRVDGTFTLSSNQVLRGNGTIWGTLAVSGGSIVSPGPTIGQLSLSGSVLFQGGGRYDVEVQDAQGVAGTGYDFIAASDQLGVQATSGNPFLIHLRSVNANRGSGWVTNFDNNTNYSWTIATGTLTNFSAAAFAVDSTAFSNDLAGGYFYAAAGSLLLNFTNNHPPVASNPSVSRPSGQPVQIPVVSLGSDPDGDPIALLSISNHGTNGGVVNYDGTNVYYAPGVNGDVTDQVAYVIGDVRTNPPAIYRAGDTHRTAAGNIVITVTGGSVNNATQRVVSVTILPDHNKRITFSAGSNTTYVVQAATNLSRPIQWVNISTDVSGPNGTWTVDDLQATNHPRRFYRSTLP